MKKRAYLFILAAAVLWGTTGTAQALAPQGAQPLAIGSLRLLVSGIALVNLRLVQPAARPADLRAALIGPMLLARACMAAYQVLFFAGVKMTGVAVGTIVGIGSSPVLAGAAGLCFPRRAPGLALGRGHAAGRRRLRAAGWRRRNGRR